MFIKNKNVLITGSTSGIGLGIAKDLAAAGNNIMLNGIASEESIEQIKKDLQKFGTHILFHPANMTDPLAIRNLIQETEEKLGCIDILINNAGIQKVSPIEDFSEEDWNQIIAINMNSSFHTIKAALPGMKKRGWGRLINISSAHGLVASPFKSAYVTAKHGITGLTKTVALETAQYGITCNAICPGYVLTDLVAQQIPATAKARGITEEEVKNNVLLAAQWTKKFVTVKEIAGVVLFLCSEFADNITGISLPIDGGWTAS